MGKLLKEFAMILIFMKKFKDAHRDGGYEELLIIINIISIK